MPYLPRIFETHPFETCRILEISQGRAPEWASSMIFWRVESGNGRPLTYTPPSWLTPLWPEINRSLFSKKTPKNFQTFHLSIWNDNFKGFPPTGGPSYHILTHLLITREKFSTQPVKCKDYVLRFSYSLMIDKELEKSLSLWHIRSSEIYIYI